MNTSIEIVLDSSFKFNNKQIFGNVNSEEAQEMKKIIECAIEPPTGLLLRTNTELLSKKHLEKISKNKADWIVGLTTSGIPVYIIVSFNKNYIFSAIDGKLLTCIKPFLHPQEYESSIFIGTLTYTNNEIIFVAEEVDMLNGQKLCNKTFNERYSLLFNVKYDNNSDITLSIVTLWKIEFISKLFIDVDVPFQTDGLSFIPLNKISNLLSRNEIIWKRAQDYTVNFNIRKSTTDIPNPPLTVGNEQRINYKFDMLLKNCKRPTYTTTNNKYTEFDGKCVEAICYEQNWIIKKETNLPTTNTNQFKIITAAIKENIELQQIYKGLK